MTFPKIIDCFPYFNEEELLELRINLFYDYVDKFIIVDADHTHSGLPKPFTCKETIRRLGLPKDKIEVIEVNLPSIEQCRDNWYRERLQRNVASFLFQEDCVYHVSDCDEMIDPEKIKLYAEGCVQNKNTIIRIPLAYLIGRADLRVYDKKQNPRTWSTPFLCMKHHVEKHTLSDIRESYAMSKNNLDFSDLYLMDQNGNPVESGWHFSWMGDTNRIKTKSVAYLHAYDHDTFSNAVAPLYAKEYQEFLDSYEPKEGSTDPYGRDDHILKKYPKELLPQKIFELPNVEKFLFQTYD